MSFPAFTNVLHDLIVEILSAIAGDSTSEGKSRAVRFLYRLLHMYPIDSEFKWKLENCSALKPLFKHPVYGQDIGLLEDSENQVDLPAVSPTPGFPLTFKIPAGESASYIAEIPEQNCLLHWGFATEHYDISYSLSRLDQPEVLIPETRVSSASEPVSDIRLITSPGLYKFTWSNSYSWLHSKHLRFRVVVLRPVLAASPYEAQGVARKTITLLSTGPIPSQGNSLEIGVYIKKNSIHLAALDIKEIVNYEKEEEISMCIAGFTQTMTKAGEFAQVQIGIIEKEPRLRDELGAMGALAIARDADAIGLLTHASLHPHTVISVVNEDGLRSCVIHKGRILLSEDGVPIGDLSGLPESDPVDGISGLLCLFGPAVLVLTGSDFTGGSRILLEKIKETVPNEIWEHSVIRESPFTASVGLEAASKLHYLHSRYKFAL